MTQKEPHAVIVTRNRERIMEALFHADGPLSRNAISHLADARIDGVERTLKLLEELGWVHDPYAASRRSCEARQFALTEEGQRRVREIL